MTSRIRNDNSDWISHNYEHIKTDLPSGVETIVGTSNYNWLASEKRMVDVVSSNFKSRIASGEVINNPCVLSVGEWTEVRGDYFASQNNGSHTYHSGGDGNIINYLSSVGIVGTEPSLDDPTSDLIKKARLHAIANIDKTPHSFGEDVGELRQTLRFMRNPLASLASLSKAFKRDRVVRERKILSDARRRKAKITRHKAQAQALSESWVTYRFAFSPLVRSLSDLAVALGEKPYVRPDRRTARGYDNHTEEEAITSVSVGHTFDNSVSLDVQVRAGILYEITSPYSSVASKYGLRIKDVPHTIWQLLPYSFMVDRIVDISSVIRGLTNLSDPRLHILAAWVTTHKEHLQTWRVVSQTSGSYTITMSPSGWDRKDFSYIRTPWSVSVGDLTPEFDLSGLVADVTSTLDLISLTILRLK